MKIQLTYLRAILSNHLYSLRRKVKSFLECRISNTVLTATFIIAENVRCRAKNTREIEHLSHSCARTELHRLTLYMIRALRVHWQTALTIYATLLSIIVIYLCKLYPLCSLFIPFCTYKLILALLRLYVRFARLYIFYYLLHTATKLWNHCEWIR